MIYIILLHYIKYLKKIKFSYIKYVPVILHIFFKNNNFVNCDGNIENEKLLQRAKINAIKFNIKQSNRNFGIELEFIGLKSIFDKLLDVLNNNNNNWILTIDGTFIDEIDNKTYGMFELISPILDDINKIDKKVLQLHDLYVETNIKTGFHVHIDANDLTEEQIINVIISWLNVETYMDQFIAPTRRNLFNKYCQPLNMYIKNDRKYISDILNFKIEHHIKFTKLNIIELNIFCKNKHFEFRSHEGTLNIYIIKLWTEFLRKFVDISKDTIIDNDNVDDLLREYIDLLLSKSSTYEYLFPNIWK